MKSTALLAALFLIPGCLFAAVNDSSTPPVAPALTSTQPTAEPSLGNGNDETTEDLFDLISKQDVSEQTNSETGEAAFVEPADPLSKYNHVVFNINDFLDKYIAKPAANIYIKVVPRPVANMIANFYINLDYFPTVGNDLLQANFYQAVTDSWHLGINSTVGIGGAFDVASEMGLAPNYEDFGLTLAQWGWTDSSYFIIPILGPSSIRDALGRPVNYYMSPYPYIDNIALRNSLYVVNLLNQRVQFLKAQDLYDSAAINPYVFMRNAYIQRRTYLINRNKELDNPYTAKDMKRYRNPNYLYR